MTMVHLHAQKRAEMSDHCLMVLVAWMLHCSNSRQAEGKVRRGGFGKKKVSEKPKMWKQKFWKYILYVKWLCSCLLSDTISVHSLQEHFLQVVFFFFPLKRFHFKQSQVQVCDYVAGGVVDAVVLASRE